MHQEFLSLSPKKESFQKFCVYLKKIEGRICLLNFTQLTNCIITQQKMHIHTQNDVKLVGKIPFLVD